MYVYNNTHHTKYIKLRPNYVEVKNELKLKWGKWN